MKEEYEFDYDRAVAHKSDFMKAVFDRMPTEEQRRQDREFQELSKIPKIKDLLWKFEQSENMKEVLECQALLTDLILMSRTHK